MSGIFEPLIGYDGAKAILRAALRDGSVNILLEGPPASGKSVALLAIEEHAPNSGYKDAAGFSEVQLRETFAQDYNILCLDEIDAMRSGAYEAMSTPMEHGRVTKDTAHNQYDVTISTQVIAACNNADDLPSHIASRFRTVEFDEYSHDEFVAVCQKLLTESVDWIETEEQAAAVAKTVHESIGSKDPRDARDAGKLASNVEEVGEIAKALEDPTANVNSEPLTASELADAQMDERSTRKTKSVDEVAEDMADLDDVRERTVSEVEGMLDEAGITMDHDDPGKQFISKLKDSGNRTISNSYGQPIVELIVHEEISEATSNLISEWDLNPSGHDVFPQDPSFADERPGPAETLVSFQFLLDEAGDPKSSGYDLEQIAARLDNEVAMATASNTADYELF